MITDRDKKMFEIMSNFGGKTFINVLAKTLYNDEQQARNRLNKLKKDKLIRYKKTGLMSPRNAIYFTEKGKKYGKEELNLNVVETAISSVTVHHMILEQITFYYLQKIGKDVKRTAVIKWRETHHHTPDLMYLHNDKPVYVEIERTAKRADHLAQIFANMQRDSIHKVLYVFENEKKMFQIGKKLPVFDKLLYVTIDTLIESSKQNKIGAITQTKFYENLEKGK
jgi:hypothetical protein